MAQPEPAASCSEARPAQPTAHGQSAALAPRPGNGQADLNLSREPLLTRGWRWFFALVLGVWGGHWLWSQLDTTALGLAWERLSSWGQNHLPRVVDGAPWSLVLMPAALTFALCGSLVLLCKRPPNWLRVPIWVIFSAGQLAYLFYRLVATLVLDSPGNAVVSVLFYLSEVFVHFRIAMGNMSLLHLTDRSAQADASARLVRSGMYVPTVDVFVPTYSEPVEMLRRTLIGCQAMDYARKTIYLLDDQRRPAMRALAAELGVEYICRPDNRHAKAGNLNHALARTQGELVVVFDADFVPTRDFLERTVGFFCDPQVAMVQTPQNFFNDDAVTRNLGLEGELDDEQRLFFRALQPGRDAVNAVVCHGSCFVVRRSALEAIGGVPTETITEDWATSIKLQAAGYKIYYLNEALSAGVAADKCGEFVQQRARWAQGTLQALWASTNPLTIPGLNWKQRLFHCTGILYYVGSLSSLFNLIAPLFYLFFGFHILRMTVPEMLFYRLPFQVCYYLLFSWLTNRTRSALWTELYEAFLAPSISLTVVRTFFKPFGAGFRVTDKTMSKTGLKLNRRVALPFIVLALLHVVGIGVALAMRRHLEEPDTFAIVLYFTLTNLLLFWLCVLVSIDVAQDPVVQFEHRLPCLLMWEDYGVAAETRTLSEGGLIFRLTGKQPAPLPAAGFVSLPTLELEYLPVRLSFDAQSGEIQAEFLRLTLPQRRRLIEFLFCQPGQWDKRRRPQNEPRLLAQYFLAGVRMYSLAESR
jgi:cellulose synthase (UDP-forming)